VHLIDFANVDATDLLHAGTQIHYSPASLSVQTLFEETFVFTAF